MYDGYLQRETKNALLFNSAEKIEIPPEFKFDNLPGLRNEASEVLSKFRPCTLGQASRISGVNPSDISILHIYLERFRKSINE